MIRELIVQAAQEDISWPEAFTIVGAIASIMAFLIVLVIRNS